MSNKCHPTYLVVLGDVKRNKAIHQGEVIEWSEESHFRLIVRECPSSKKWYVNIDLNALRVGDMMICGDRTFQAEETVNTNAMMHLCSWHMRDTKGGQWYWSGRGGDCGRRWSQKRIGELDCRRHLTVSLITCKTAEGFQQKNGLILFMS